MKCLNYIFILLTLSCLFSCATDIVDMTGNIRGTVKDASNNASIEGCLVTLTPTNRSTTTTSAGAFLFDDLESNTYTLAFTKDGYESQTKDLSVTVGKVANIEVLLKQIPREITVEPTSLDFGDLETTKELYLSKSGGNDTQFSIKTDQKWINISPTSGTLGKTNVKITVVVDRNELSLGEFHGTITITSSFGETSVPVFMSKAESSVPQVANGEACYDITETSFKINGTILRTGGSEITTYGHCWSMIEDPTIADSKTNFGSTKEIGEYTSTINQNLIAGEIYYVRAYAENKVGVGYSNSVRVTIPKTTQPTVATLEPKGVAKNSAVLNGSITDTGNGEITECGFYYGKTNNPTTKVVCSSVTTDFSYDLSQLEEDVTYYYKAYAKNEKGESCGEVVSFTTAKTAKLIVVTMPSTDVTKNSAVIHGTITDEGEGKVTECGFFYGTTSNPTTKITNSAVATKFSYSLSSLSDGTTYYYKAYAKNEKGESYGEVVSFTTPEITKPTVETISSTDVTKNSAVIHGTITDDGEGKVTECGFYYGTTSNPTTKIANSSVATKFSYSLSSLSDGTTYYYKAYAKNEKGESCGEVLSFTTSEIATPTVVTMSSTDVAKTSAVIHGTITDDGEGKVTECGFYYGTTSNPTTKITNSSVATNFSYSLSSLSDGTTYYYKAYAKNEKGESCGEILSFTTSEIATPTVETMATTNVTESSAVINGKITDAGDGKITECGFYYGTTSNPTTKIANSSVATNFSYNLSSLSDGTTYYYKAYAKNEKGESCGDVLSFTTSQIIKPTVVTLASTDVTENSAVINGSITDTGTGKITECGFYYGKTSNPTTKITSSSVGNTFSYNLSSLSDGTTYYYKAYAKNEKAESCGEVMSFSTLQEALMRGVTTENATNIGYSSATITASIWGDFKGAKEVSEYGFYIGTNQYQMQKKAAKSLTNNSFELEQTGLSPTTKYYYYAYVICYDRTELKGEMQTFTTQQKPYITSVKYYSSKTVDKQLWLNLTATVASAGLYIKDAGFLMGNVKDSDNLHSSYNSITIVPCEFQSNTVSYEGLAKDYLSKGNDPGTYIKPYFVFEDGTEVYGKVEYMYDGRKIENQY